MDVADRIDRLFDDDEPQADETGVLATLAVSLGDLRPRALIHAGSNHTIERVHQPDSPAINRETLREVLARALARDSGTSETSDGTWVVRTEDPHQVLVVLCGRDPLEVTPGRREELTATAVVALNSLALHGDRQQLRQRVHQLQNEHGALSASHDHIVTELLETKEAQARQQREYVEKLEAEVDRRSAALREALEQAERASQAKTSLLANMSHELRTPLTAILGYADLLLEPGFSPEDVVEYARTIHANGSHLLGVMNDVLDVTMLEGHTMLLEESRFSLADLIRETVEQHQSRAEERGIQLISSIAEGNTEMVSDLDRVRQILHNLVDNAIKFTEQGEVRISAEIRRVGDVDYSLIEVQDTGVGVDAEALDTLFRPFTQADGSSTRQFGGTGLGLSISRNLARLLGGDITVSSGPGQGSTFRVMLRREARTEGSENPDSTDSPQSQDFESPWRLDEELVGFLHEFLDGVPLRLDNMTHSVTSGDWARSTREAESLEQEAETVGLEGLRRAADDLIRAAGSEDTSAVLQSVTAVRDMLPRIPRG